MSTKRKPNSGNPGQVNVGIATSDGIHFSGDRARPSLLDEPTPGVHLWIATAAHVLSDESAATAHNGGQVHLDAETVAFIGVGCYVCEQSYSSQLAARRCTGDPNAHEGVTR